jgi:hypothetical protein
MAGEIDNESLQNTVAVSEPDALSRYAGDVSTNGDNVIVVAPATGSKIRVWGYALQGHGTVNAKFTDGASGAQLTMTWNWQAREGVMQPVGRYAVFECTAATALILNLSAGVEVGVELVYDVVPA